MDQKDAIRRSALWAAYGDALGFITELADAALVRRRTGQSVVHSLINWRRRIGGKFGIEVQLPQGCYSDDTQLRLATCRAINAHGALDVEAFAKIELPVWRAYALGAGYGSKAAAQSLIRLDMQWCGNFYKSGQSRYVNGGGNGAAMRIQPHVWASPLTRRDSDVLREIIRNSVVTHGHPRGILGAAFHGLCLRHTFRVGAIPSPSDWHKILENLGHTTKLIRKDDQLATYWLPRWEQDADCKVDDAFNRVLDELRHDIASLDHMPFDGSPADAYGKAVEALGGFAADNRGSGTKTAVLASFLSLKCEGKPLDAVRAAANLLGSDTDTIATMAGAMLGALCESDPPEPVADTPYIVAEAERLYLISQGQDTSAFNYPDLLYWQPPKTELDAVRCDDGKWSVAGLGPAVPVGDIYEKNGKSPFAWQWFKLQCGQNVLLKHRPKAGTVAQAQLPFESGKDEVSANHSEVQNTERPTRSRDVTKALGVDEAVEAVVNSRFDPRVVGAMLLELVAISGSSELAITFARRIAEEKGAKRRTSGQ